MKRYNLELKVTFLLCSLLGSTNISLSCIVLLSERGDYVADITINRYWTVIQVRKEHCNMKYVQLSENEEINISAYIKSL